MFIQGDVRANEFILLALFENECQFFVTYENNKKLRVAFNKGIWRLMDEKGRFLEISDAVSVVECNNDLLRGLAEQIIDNDKTAYDCRKTPAGIINKIVAIWLASSKEITQIDIIQAERNGWFLNFED